MIFSKYHQRLIDYKKLLLILKNQALLLPEIEYSKKQKKKNTSSSNQYVPRSTQNIKKTHFIIKPNTLFVLLRV